MAKRSNPKVEEVNARVWGFKITRAGSDSLSKVNLVKSAVTSILASPNRLHYGFEVEVELSSAHHITVIIRCQHHDAGGNTLTTTTTRLFHKLSSDIDHPFKHVPDTQGSESWDEDPVGDSPAITQKKKRQEKRK